MTKILVVDDDVFTQEMLSKALSQRDVEVYTVGGGEAALEIIQDVGDVDLVITDMKMPGMDGETLARRIKRSHPRIWVIGISGGAEQRSRDSSLDYFLPKPFSLSLLFGAVRRLLEERSMRVAPPVESGGLRAHPPGSS